MMPTCTEPTCGTLCSRTPTCTGPTHAADLTYAQLRGADLQGADLRDVRGLTRAQVDVARTNGGTLLPPRLLV